ncbi:hypothetical protein BZL30_1380 [Mycobacterium kansasii]|uniref:Uncharacterized protein n=1 Tax=Mycobacterium kansasii TaxID=1768 RepID=A0A1V3XU27_MYCKA|nr:hypothetical protein BZL30_1380 [Mycobacterium kansasii]
MKGAHGDRIDQIGPRRGRPTPALPGHFAFAANRAQSLQAPSASTKPWPPIPVSNQPPENTLRPAISGR